MVVYVDTLFLINSVLDYFILLGVRLFSGTSYKWYKIALSACLGGLLGSAIFILSEAYVFPWAAKLAVPPVLCAAAFGVKKIKKLLKEILVFYMISFLFGGAVFAIYMFTPLAGASGFKMSGGALYMDVSFFAVSLAGFFVYILTIIFCKIFKRSGIIKDLSAQIEIGINGKKVRLRGFIDTGNSLKEPISGCGVILAELKSVEPILPERERDFFAGKGPFVNDIKTRVIPFKSAGESGGMLNAFLPDELILKKGGDTIFLKGTYVALIDMNLSEDYDALISPDMINHSF